MSKFKVGDKVRIKMPFSHPHNGLTAKITSQSSAQNTWWVKFNDGSDSRFEEKHMVLESSAREFKVGDVVKVNDPRLVGHKFTIITIFQDLADLTSPTFPHPITVKDCHTVLTLIGAGECQHEWKRIDLFMSTEFHCIHCTVTRPFDIEKDAA